MLGTAFALAWLPFNILFVQDALRNPALRSVRVTLIGLIAVFSAIYALHWAWARHRPETWLRIAVTGAMTALAVVIVEIGGAAYGPIFIYSTVSAAAAFEARGAMVAAGVNCAIVLFGDYSIVHDWVEAGLATLQMALFGVAVVATGAMGRTVFALREARDELARLAVNEERLRFARDLHDLLGHSLSVVVLKSELAGNLMRSDPERAAREIADVERVARNSLREVREAVAGYRATSLKAEIHGAREMLEAAGIACSVEDHAVDLSPTSDSVLGWAVREGATNVVRHSSARECRVRVWREDSAAWLELADDGRGAKGGLGSGHGLAGLSERAAAIGGRVETSNGDTPGFRLRVTVPARAGSGDA